MLMFLRKWLDIDSNEPMNETIWFRFWCALSILYVARTRAARTALYKRERLASLDEGTLRELVEWVVTPWDWVVAYALHAESKRSINRAPPVVPTSALLPAIYDEEECVEVLVDATPRKR